MAKFIAPPRNPVFHAGLFCFPDSRNIKTCKPKLPMKTTALLLTICSLILLGAFNPAHATQNVLPSLENLVTAGCDTPDPGNEDHYE